MKKFVPLFEEFINKKKKKKTPSDLSLPCTNCEETHKEIAKELNTLAAETGEPAPAVSESQDEWADKFMNAKTDKEKEDTEREFNEKVSKKQKEEREKRDAERTTLTVTFENLDKSDLLELQKMFTAMDWSGSVGASREMKVYVDGDGAFRSKIKMSPAPAKDNKDIQKAIDEFDNEKLSIGLGC